LVLEGEVGPLRLFRQVEVAAERTLAEDRYGEQRAHRRMVDGKADRAWILPDVGHPEALPLDEHHAQQAVTDRRRADPRALLGADPGGDERLDPVAVVDHRAGAVPRIDRVPGPAPGALQPGLKGELAMDVERGLVEREELAVAQLEAGLDPLED